MKPDELLRAILPDVLIDNFDVDRFEKSDSRFDIWLDEKKVQMREDVQQFSNINNGMRTITRLGRSSHDGFYRLILPISNTTSRKYQLIKSPLSIASWA